MGALVLGTFTHPITLYSLSGDHSETVDALVDTGSTFTALPLPLMERSGATQEYSVSLRLANGRIGRRSIAEIKAELNGSIRTILCVPGDPGFPPIIGAVTLEVFLLSVDLVERRLVPVVGYWL